MATKPVTLFKRTARKIANRAAMVGATAALAAATVACEPDELVNPADPKNPTEQPGNPAKHDVYTVTEKTLTDSLFVYHNLRYVEHRKFLSEVLASKVLDIHFGKSDPNDNVGYHNCWEAFFDVLKTALLKIKTEGIWDGYTTSVKEIRITFDNPPDIIGADLFHNTLFSFAEAAKLAQAGQKPMFWTGDYTTATNNQGKSYLAPVYIEWPKDVKLTVTRTDAAKNEIGFYIPVFQYRLDRGIPRDADMEFEEYNHIVRKLYVALSYGFKVHVSSLYGMRGFYVQTPSTGRFKSVDFANALVLDQRIAENDDWIHPSYPHTDDPYPKGATATYNPPATRAATKTVDFMDYAVQSSKANGK